MSRFPRERWWQRVLYTWPTVLILIIVLGWFSRSVWSAYKRYLLVQGARQELKADLAEAVAHREELVAEIVFLETERGLEERLRSSLPVAKVGEGVIVVVPATTTLEELPPQSWWQKVFGYIKKRA